MEESASMQNKTSWLTAICGVCGILLLAVYIVWSPAEKDASSNPLHKAETQSGQTKSTEFAGQAE